MKYIISLFIMSIAVSAHTADQKSDPKPDMQELLHDIKALEKFLISEQQFLDPKNENVISEKLQHMDSHLSRMQGKHFKADPAMQMNLQMFSQHVKETKQFFSSKNKTFARYMLKSSLHMCISCHSRMKEGAELDIPLSADIPLTPENAFDRAEFFFATRQFTKALDLFKQVISSFPSKAVAHYHLSRAMNSIAVIYARVLSDPKSAADYFEKVKIMPIPLYLQKDAGAWAASFRQWSKKGGRDPSKMTDKELLATAKELLKKDNFDVVSDSERKFHVDRLRSAALLHRVLDSPNNSLEKAQSLYLLGLIYHRLDNNLFFNFDEMYLKACINGYPKTKVAQDCYDTLESILIQGYTGSSGTHLPTEAELELMRLKKIAY